MQPPNAPSRRSVVAAATLAPTSALSGPLSSRAAGDALARTAGDLKRYVDFGIKHSGGEGDAAAGAWMEAEARAAGYAVQRQAFDAPFFAVREASLKAGEASARVSPQAIVAPTGPEGLEAPLVARPVWTPADARCDGAIAIVELPYARWSSIEGGVNAIVEATFAAGAAAVVLSTTGPTKEAIALNARVGRPRFGKPVALIAPKDVVPFLRAAQKGERGRLTMTGEGGRRAAFNLVAKLDRGAGRGLMVSTPRSGWTAGGGERGGGIAVWLDLLRWAPAALPGHDLIFLATSGHEYENQGGDLFQASALAPAPAQTRLWVHLGANIAARDWVELAQLAPLSGVDSQRVLMVSAPLEPLARRTFAGQPGLEDVRIGSASTAAGELTGILSRGYERVAGVFGAHRFHHVQGDDLRMTHPEATLKAIQAFRTLIAGGMAA